MAAVERDAGGAAFPRKARVSPGLEAPVLVAFSFALPAAE